MRWFGESWGASACDPARRVATPLHRWCSVPVGGCGEPIREGDQGVLIPDASTGVEAALHLDCFLPTIGAGPCKAHGVMFCPGNGGAVTDDLHVVRWWHHLTHWHRVMGKPGVGEVVLCRRRGSARCTMSVRFADGVKLWTPSVLFDADLLRRIMMCGTAAEMREVVVGAVGPAASQRKV